MQGESMNDDGYYSDGVVNIFTRCMARCMRVMPVNVAVCFLPVPDCAYQHGHPFLYASLVAG